MNKQLLQAATTIEVPITRVGRNYFPDIQKIAGKRIKYLSAYENILPLSGRPLTTDAFIGLTENGTNYFLEDVTLDLFIDRVTNGEFTLLDRELSVMDCYVSVTDAAQIGSSCVLTLYYEDASYSTEYAAASDSRFDNFDIPVVQDGIVQRNYFPDVRTLAGKSFDELYLALVAITPKYAQGITLADAQAIYISFAKGSYNVLDRLPLTALLQETSTMRKHFKGITFDFTSSYVEVASGYANFQRTINITVKYH